MKNIYKNENSIVFKNEYLNFETGETLSPVETQNYTVIQIADSYYSSSFRIEKHRQKCDLEITYPLNTGLWCVDGRDKCKLNKYDAYISLKDDIHMLYSDKSCRFQTLAFNIKNDYGLEMYYRIRDNLSQSKNRYCPGIAPVMAEVISEFLSYDEILGKNYLDSLITNILVKLLRNKEDIKSVDILSADDLLPAIVNYIDTHFLEITSLEEISLGFGYSYNHICKTFAKRFGVSPKAYLTSKKMDHAGNLLKKGKSIGIVSEILGFSSPYNFSRAFKKHFGVCPNDCKQK